MRCFAHTLRLVVYDWLAAINSDIRAKFSLTKTKAVARLAAQSSTFAYSLPSGKVLPQLDGVQNFDCLNIYCAMLKILIQVLLRLIFQKKLIVFIADIQVLTEICECLCYF